MKRMRPEEAMRSLKMWSFKEMVETALEKR
jgi:hypothetical protein